MAYVPETALQSVASSGNYLYVPLPMAAQQADGSGVWSFISVNLAEVLQKHQLEYGHTSWISFHGVELSIDNVGFSTEMLETVLD